MTCNRLVENIVDSSLCLLNDGRITRIPDVAPHKATAIDLSLVTPDLAVNCTWYMVYRRKLSGKGSSSHYN